MAFSKFKILTLFVIALSVFSCKPENTDDQPLDYTIQVIPDIAEILSGHEDLISVMDERGKLHFGDQPPTLSSFHHSQMDNWGFVPSVPEHQDPHMPNGGEWYFRFDDQHRGIAKGDYKSIRPSSIPNQSLVYYAHSDQVYIMGDGSLFTAYFIVKQELENVENAGTLQAVILSGEVQADGIHDCCLALKIVEYDNPPLPLYSHINDIFLYRKDFMPFLDWQP